MKIKPGFILRQLAGENVVVAVGAAGEHFHGMIRLNETGAMLWKTLENGAEPADLTASLLGQFDGVTPQQAQADVDEFLAAIKDALDG